jgi:hypothetical protein
VAIVVLIESLPHWLIALAGGLASHAVIRRFRRASPQVPSRPEQSLQNSRDLLKGT